MTPLLFLIPLCIMYGGDNNCDYSFEHITDREAFEDRYTMYEGKYNPSNVGAFLVYSEKTIFFYDTDAGTVLHEINHIKCILSNVTYDEQTFCHVKLDMKDVVEKSSR